MTFSLNVVSSCTGPGGGGGEGGEGLGALFLGDDSSMGGFLVPPLLWRVTEGVVKMVAAGISPWSSGALNLRTEELRDSQRLQMSTKSPALGVQIRHLSLIPSSNPSLV